MKNIIFIFLFIFMLIPSSSHSSCFGISIERNKIVWDTNEFDMKTEELNHVGWVLDYSTACIGGYLFLQSHSGNSYPLAQVIVDDSNGKMHPVHCKVIKVKD